MNAPEAVTPVTLWRGDHYEGDSFFLSESKHQRREEWKALPAAQYAELVAYAKTGEAVEGVLIEANEDDGTMTPADVVRALVAERDAVAKIGPVEPPANETKAAEFMPPDAGEAAPAPGRKRKAKDAPAAKTFAPQADDGTVYRATYQGQTIAVAQVGAPGPWHGYFAGEPKVRDLEHSEAAKLALAEALGAKPKDLVWMSKMDNPTTDAAPKAAPRARRTAAAK